MKEKILAYVLPLLPWLIDKIKNQGFGWFLIMLVAAFFWNQTQILSIKIDNCNNSIIEMYKEDRGQMIKVIESNTLAIQNIKCK